MGRSGVVGDLTRCLKFRCECVRYVLPAIHVVCRAICVVGLEMKRICPPGGVYAVVLLFRFFQGIMSNHTSNRKVLSGEVVSDRMDKTITVEVTRLVQHDRYKKYIERSSKFKAHDENEEASEGDRVEIMETRPLAKTKNWTLKEIVERSPGAQEAEEVEV